MPFSGRFHLITGSWLACLLLLSLLFTVSAFAEETVKIAMITAKTGEAGKSNIVSFDGARYAVDEINASGGILGRKVELLEYDNMSSREGSAEAGRLAAEAGVVAVVGCNWSSHSKAMAEVLQEIGVPMISHMSTNPAVTQVGDYIFRICFTDSFQGYGLARYVRSKLKAKTAVVLVDRDRTYSQGLAKTFTEAFVKLGGKVLWQGEYGTSGSIDYDGLLEEVKKYDPKVLFIPGAYNDVAEFFGRTRDMGIWGALVSADGVGVKLYSYIGRKADGVYFSGHWSRLVDSPESKRFVEGYGKAYGPPQEDTMAMVYDSFMLLKDAIERAGTLDREKVRDAIAQTKEFKGVTGSISFDENGDPIKPMIINQLGHGGVMYLDQIYP